MDDYPLPSVLRARRPCLRGTVCWRGERSLSSVLLFLLRLAHDDAVEIASEEVAGGYSQPEGKYLGQVGNGEVHRYAQIEERICHTMGESAIDEDYVAALKGLFHSRV